MKLEILNTGSELLLGQILNTHAAYIGQQLLPHGLRVQRQTCVADGDPIGEALSEAFERCDVILVTGGLGPTSDDLTREVIAGLLGLELELDQTILDHIRSIFENMGRQMPETNRRQAMVPVGATVLANPLGTAPGFYFPAGAGRNPHLFVLPGPPRELVPMFEGLVLPRLIELAGIVEVPAMRRYRFAGIGESHLAEIIEPELRRLGQLEIGYCAQPGEVEVRVIGPDEIIGRSEQVILEAASEYLVSADGSSLEQTLVRLLTERKLQIATAESCTGGYIAHALTNVSGASEVFRQGYVTYADKAKVELLGVPEDLLDAHGAVSEPVALAMAEGCLERAKVDLAVAVTGVAGPTGGTTDKPVGTVYIGQAAKGAATFVKRYRFPMERLAFKERTALMALELVRRRILGILQS